MTAKQLILILSNLPEDKEIYIQTGGEPMYFKAYSVREKELVDFDTDSDEEIDVIVIDYE